MGVKAKVNDDDFIAAYHTALEASDKKSMHAVSKLMAETLPYSAGYVRVRMQRLEKRIAEGNEIPLDEATVQRNADQMKASLKNQVSTYVVTWAQNATPVHTPFLKALENYIGDMDAQLVVIPGRYKNPTSIFNAASDYWVDEIAPYLMNHRMDLGPNCIVMGNAKIQPTAVTPLTGLETITHDKSGIFGHPKVQLTSVATPHQKLPKLLTTTGAVTVQNYTDSKAGIKGEFHHTLGATVIEIDGDTFHMRQINACDDGSFIDLEWEYRADGIYKAEPPLALVMGDVHAEFMDPDVEAATFFNDDCIMKTLKPEAVVVHDWFDGYSGSHHHERMPFTRFAKQQAGKDNVKEEVQRTFDKLLTWADVVSPQVGFHIVASNHNDHLLTWLERNSPQNDPKNALFYHELSAMVLRKIVYGDSGAEVPNPLELLANDMLDMSNLHFLGREESLMFAGVECSLHGDKGANGSRGSVKAYARMGVKSITGHGHSPGIEGGAFRTGTNSMLRLEYTSGPSSWLHTDCLIYANGKRSLIHFIKGEWRAKR